MICRGSLVWLVFSLLVPNTFGKPGLYRICRSDQYCVRLTKCPSYMNLIRNIGPLTKATIAFLQQQECDFDGSFPKVCCFYSRPELNIANVEVTARPAGRGSALVEWNGRPAEHTSADSKDALKKKKKIEAFNEAFAQMDLFMLRQH